MRTANSDNEHSTPDYIYNPNHFQQHEYRDECSE
jgi:hypothetical protein